MNTERIIELADHVEKLEHVHSTPPLSMFGKAFDMGIWKFRCGAPACTAGHTVYLWAWNDDFDNLAIECQARVLLDLDVETADELFTPPDICSDDVTPAMAAAVLRNLALTGEVVWPELDLPQ